jgi:hypothetical protein
MTTNHVAVRAKNAVARPLKVLVPLIRKNIRLGDEAGVTYYRLAGDDLREAKDSGQIPSHRWNAWVSKNIAISSRTASRYMRFSEIYEEAQEASGRDDVVPFKEDEKYYALANPGAAQTRRERESARKPLHEAVKRIDVDYLAREQTSRREETQLHRDIALELIDIGFKALATRLHPDRGGSRDAMRRLNRVRDELKSVAETRRFE